MARTLVAILAFAVLPALPAMTQDNAKKRPPTTPLDPVGVVPVQQTSKEFGLRITEIDPGPAQKAGLKVGDVIVAVGEFRVQSFEDLRQLVQSASGDLVVTYWNNAAGKLQTVTVSPVEKRIGISVVAIEIE
jgi:S1-C subfamily serine protease